MSGPCTLFASAVNLFCTSAYYVTRKSALQNDALLKQCSGIVAAALFNSTRSYTTPYLKQWFNERQIDTLHGAASVLMIGLATYYAKLSLKTHFATLVFFTGLHIVTHKVTSHLFRDQLAYEGRNRHRQKSTFKNAGWLRTELFPEKQGYARGNATAYLYAMPEGFFVFLSQNGGLPFFPDRMGSIDSSEVCKIQEEICGTLELSSESLQRLQEQAKQVSFDRVPTEWELEGIPPFVCFEGKWNAEHNPLGASVNWEDLILKGLSQRHEAFELRPIAATWTTRPQTPGLRGFSFSHTDSRFSIWVHEKNVGALENEKDSLVEEVADFRTMLKFLRDFDNAAYAFLPTMTLPASPQGAINWDTIGQWFNLIINNPFSHLFPGLRERYRPLQHLIHQQNATEEQRLELIEVFRQFFETLPREAHFPTNIVFSEKFQTARLAFYSAGKDLVRSGDYIDIKSLEEWLELLKRTRFHLGTCEELETLIANSQEYLTTNTAISRMGRSRTGDPAPLRERRTALAPLLKNGYTWFFKNYEPTMRYKGGFAKDLNDQILLREKKHAQLEAFALCENGLGVFSVENYLKEDENSLSVLRLEAWKKFLELNRYSSYQMYQDLIRNCETYLRSHARAPTSAEKTILIQQIIAGFNWVFGTYVPGLEAEAKRNFLARFAEQVKCPRSHVASTAQIAYYSYLEPFHLHAIIRRNRAYQLTALTSAMSSKVSDVRYVDQTLPDIFCIRLNEVCTRASDFMVRKAQSLKTLQQDWNETATEIIQTPRCTDGEEYRLQPFQGNQARDASRHLVDISQALGSLHTAVNHTDEAAYLASPFLQEEAQLVTELYTVANEMCFLLQVRLDWNFHRVLHEHSLQTLKATRALADGQNYSVYKRVSEGGHVLWDIVRDNETSALEKRNAVHTAIYYPRNNI